VYAEADLQTAGLAQMHDLSGAGPKGLGGAKPAPPSDDPDFGLRHVCSVAGKVPLLPGSGLFSARALPQRSHGRAREPEG
jgi:hypothetical protein